MTDSVIALEQSMLFVYQDGQSLVSLVTSGSRLLMYLPQSCLATLPAQPCHLSSDSLGGRAHSPAWHQANWLTYCCMGQGVSWALGTEGLCQGAGGVKAHSGSQPGAMMLRNKGEQDILCALCQRCVRHPGTWAQKGSLQSTVMLTICIPSPVCHLLNPRSS